MAEVLRDFRNTFPRSALDSIVRIRASRKNLTSGLPWDHRAKPDPAVEKKRVLVRTVAGLDVEGLRELLVVARARLAQQGADESVADVIESLDVEGLKELRKGAQVRLVELGGLPSLGRAATAIDGQLHPHATFRSPVRPSGLGRQFRFNTPIVTDEGGEHRRTDGTAFTGGVGNLVGGVPKPSFLEWAMLTPEGWSDPASDVRVDPPVEIEPKKPEGQLDFDAFLKEAAHPHHYFRGVVDVVSLCSGIGMLDLGLVQGLQREKLAVRHLAMVEINPWARQVLMRRFPALDPLDDVREDSVIESLPEADVLVAGFPCGPFSCQNQSGQHAGGSLDLWGRMIKAIERVQPGVALFENVTGILYSREGSSRSDATDEEKKLRNKTVEIVRDLDRLDYDVTWQEVCAGNLGAPHNRPRWIAVAWRRVRRRPLQLAAENPADPPNGRRLWHWTQAVAPARAPGRGGFWEPYTESDLREKGWLDPVAPKGQVSELDRERVRALAGGVVVPVGAHGAAEVARFLLGGTPFPTTVEKRPAGQRKREAERKKRPRSEARIEESSELLADVSDPASAQVAPRTLRPADGLPPEPVLAPPTSNTEDEVIGSVDQGRKTHLQEEAGGVVTLDEHPISHEPSNEGDRILYDLIAERKGAQGTG